MKREDVLREQRPYLKERVLAVPWGILILM